MFNAAPRLCLGKSLAYLEVKLLTAVLAQRFDFGAKRAPSCEYRSTLVMPLRHGLFVTVAARNDGDKVDGDGDNNNGGGDGDDDVQPPPPAAAAARRPRRFTAQ